MGRERAWLSCVVMTLGAVCKVGPASQSAGPPWTTARAQVTDTSLKVTGVNLPPKRLVSKSACISFLGPGSVLKQNSFLGLHPEISPILLEFSCFFS